MSRSIPQEAVCSYGGTPPQLVTTQTVKTTHVAMEAVCRQAGTTQTVVTELPPT